MLVGVKDMLVGEPSLVGTEIGERGIGNAIRHAPFMCEHTNIYNIYTFRTSIDLDVQQPQRPYVEHQNLISTTPYSRGVNHQELCDFGVSMIERAVCLTSIESTPPAMQPSTLVDDKPRLVGFRKHGFN